MKPKIPCIKVSLAEDEYLGTSIYDCIMDHYAIYSKHKRSEDNTGLFEARDIINGRGYERLRALREGIKNEA